MDEKPEEYQADLLEQCGLLDFQYHLHKLSNNVKSVTLSSPSISSSITLPMDLHHQSQ